MLSEQTKLITNVKNNIQVLEFYWGIDIFCFVFIFGMGIKWLKYLENSQNLARISI